MDKFLLAEAEEIRAIVNILKWLIIFGAITFFASHLTIITQLPKIRRLLEAMCLDTEEKEEEFKEKQYKENISFIIRFVVYASIIAIAIFCLFFIR